MVASNQEQDSGDDVTGSYSGTFARTTTTTVQESSSHAGSSDAYTEVTTDTSSGPEWGDSVTGSFAQVSTGGSTLSTLQDSGSDAGGAYTVAEQDTGDYSSTKTGDSVSGTYTTTRTATDNYSMTETCSSATVTETGTTQTTTTETGNSQTADYTRTISGTDSYTLGEAGTNATGSYQESVWGSDAYTQTETGNSLNQTFSRSISGTGTYTRTESGSGATFGSGSGSLGYTVQETGDSRGGVLSQSETGDDRYSLLESFDNVANAGSNSSPGHLDYSPDGLPFSDPPPYASLEGLPSEVVDILKKKYPNVYNFLAQRGVSVSQKGGLFRTWTNEGNTTDVTIGAKGPVEIALADHWINENDKWANDIVGRVSAYVESRAPRPDLLLPTPGSVDAIRAEWNARKQGRMAGGQSEGGAIARMVIEDFFMPEGVTSTSGIGENLITAAGGFAGAKMPGLQSSPEPRVVETGLPGLYRPGLRVATKKAILESTQRAPDGRFIDMGTRKPIDGPVDFSHVYGRENWRLITEGLENGMTQKEFADWVNSHPEWFRIEGRSENQSHRNEKPPK